MGDPVINPAREEAAGGAAATSHPVAGLAPAVMSRVQVRDYDRRLIASGVPGIDLMENAGGKVVRALFRASAGQPGPVTIVTGKGNNGGDGFVIARRLHEAGHPLRLIPLVSPNRLDGDARIAWDGMIAAGVTPSVSSLGGGWAELIRGSESGTTPPTGRRDVARDPADARSFDRGHPGWMIDAILGTGARGPIGEPFRGAIDAMNRSERPILAVDLPSGLDPDTGSPLDAGPLDPNDPLSGPVVVRAARTVTFVAMKRGFLNPAARVFTGPVEVVSILERELNLP